MAIWKTESGKSLYLPRMNKRRTILEPARFELTLDRLCYELIEEYQDFSNTCLIGIQPRGVLLADVLHERLIQKLKIKSFPYGKLDITFFRDDFRTRNKPLEASENSMDFLVEDQRVILVDDVLYSGRTVQSAMSALQQYGRPRQVELVVLVDRRFNRHLPIQSDYCGMRVDALDQAYVKVDWGSEPGKHQILLYQEKED